MKFRKDEVYFPMRQREIKKWRDYFETIKPLTIETIMNKSGCSKRIARKQLAWYEAQIDVENNKPQEYRWPDSKVFTSLWNIFKYKMFCFWHLFIRRKVIVPTIKGWVLK
jgi:hypothetical protein